MIPETLKIWWLALRPKTLGAAIAPVLVGTGMAFADDKGHILAALAALLVDFLDQRIEGGSRFQLRVIFREFASGNRCAISLKYGTCFCLCHALLVARDITKSICCMN